MDSDGSQREGQYQARLSRHTRGEFAAAHPGMRDEPSQGQSTFLPDVLDELISQLAELVQELPPKQLADKIINWFFIKLNFARYPIDERSFRECELASSLPSTKMRGTIKLTSCSLRESIPEINSDRSFERSRSPSGVYRTCSGCPACS